MDSTQNKLTEEKVVFNGKEITVEKFQEEKKELESQKGVKVVEVQPNQYKTRIQE